MAQRTRPRETALPEAATDLVGTQTAMSRMTGAPPPPTDTTSSRAQVDAMLNGFTICGLDNNNSSTARSTSFETVMAAASNGKGLAANRQQQNVPEYLAA